MTNHLNLRWTVADMDLLRQLVFDNVPTAQIAQRLKATVQEIAELKDRNRAYLETGYK